MDDLDDFMLFNACEDAREEQERIATSEYPYQKQFFQPSDASGKSANHQHDECCDANGKIESTGAGSGPSAVNSEGGHHSKLGCFLLVVVVLGVLAFLLFGDIMNSCLGNHDDGCATDSDSIEVFCTIAADPKDTLTSQSEDDVLESTGSTYSSGYSDDDEYDEDWMYKDEDEDIKEKREYDDYDDDEADDWE